MRNLYMYYKKLKQTIVKKQQAGTNGSGTGSAANRSASANSAGSGTSGISGLSADSAIGKQSAPEQAKDSQATGTGVTNTSDKGKKPGEYPGAPLNQNFINSNPEEKKGQSLQELMADGDISNSGMTDA